ncbi:MAG: hypothetical protein ACP5E5_07165 [Acidobacteriaceae bacterium]
MEAVRRRQRNQFQLSKDATLSCMDPLRHGRGSGWGKLRSVAMAGALTLLSLFPIFNLVGCASPGPPVAPSLRLPKPVSDLTVRRIGDTVQLSFTAPTETTDKVALRGSIPGEFCRQLPHQRCIPVPSSKTTIQAGGSKGHGKKQGASGSGSGKSRVTWTDKLPAKLTTGPAELLAYRVEFFSPAQHSAGFSNPAYTATGSAPAPVTGLLAQGSRLGIILSWNPAPKPPDGSSTGAAEVVLQREDLSPVKPQTKTKGQTAPKASQPKAVWLLANSPEVDSSVGAQNLNRTLDTSVQPDIAYRYIAERRVTLHISETDDKQKGQPALTQEILLRSTPSAPVDFTLLQTFPPQAPTGLTAVGYFNPTPTGTPADFAVDLIWQPIDASGLMTPLAGYNLYRQPLDGSGRPIAPNQRLNTTPLPTPAFHDSQASPTTAYRYGVTAVDVKGNESPLDTTLLEPTSR